MDYPAVYDRFITARRSSEAGLMSGGEVHHIIPRCLGGRDTPDNLIRLSCEDHMFAHVLLAKIHGGPLVQAAVRMSGMSRYRGKHTRSRYAHLRAQMARLMRGNKRCVGRVTGPETSEKKRAAWTPEMRERQRLRMLGNKHGLNQSPEMRAKISAIQLERRARERGQLQ